MAGGKRPDFNIGVKDPTTGGTNSNIGAAWKNEDGSIGIKLNPGVALTSNLQIRLFPPSDKKKLTKPDPFEGVPTKPTRAQASLLRGSPHGFDDMDDDIPF